MSGTAVLGVSDGLVRMQVADAAAAFAARTGRAVRVVHVHTGPPPAPDADAGVRTQVYLGRRAPALAVERLCTVGDPAEALLDAVRPDGVVVLGDRHVRLGTPAGRTTLDVVAGAVCPVLVVPEYRPSVGGAVRRGGVVAALDGSTADDGVLAAAGDASGAGPAPVRILDAALPQVARGAGLVVVGLPSSDRPGSVGVRLLADSPCPVLLVPAADQCPRAATPVDATGPAV